MPEMDAEQARQIVEKAREIVVSGHESAHAVASVRLGLRFEYVTLDDPTIGPHVQSIDNVPRPIAFYRGSGDCCDPSRTICSLCQTEQERAESLMVVAMSGSIGARGSGITAFGYGEGADKEYVIEFCRIAFGDRTVEAAEARMSRVLDRALALMHPEGRTVTAVAKALRERRRLTESEVRQIVQDASS